MQKKLRATDFVKEMRHVENYLDFEQLVHIIQHALQGFILVKNITLGQPQRQKILVILCRSGFVVY